MTHKRHGAAEASQSSAYSFVYYYLLAGLGLVIASFIFLPRVAA
jgi:hypothetical protein